MSLKLADEFITVKVIQGQLHKGAHIVDLGSGMSESLQRLNDLGYQVQGVDKTIDPLPEGWKGDLRHTPFQSQSFDAVIAECSLSVCGNTQEGLKEAYRLLKPDGILVLLDICRLHSSVAVPSKDQWISWLTKQGFAVRFCRDFTRLYHEELLHRIWNLEDLSCELEGTQGIKLSEVGYWLFVAGKEINDGQTHADT